MASARDLEEGIERDFSGNLSYGEYLDLDRVLSAQHPRSVPERHDEMLFIIQRGRVQDVTPSGYHGAPGEGSDG